LYNPDPHDRESRDAAFAGEPNPGGGAASPIAASHGNEGFLPFEPGKTCWRIERAGRAAVLIDSADYFAALNVALEAARHSVFIIGWDFNHRIKLRPGVSGSPTLWRYFSRLVRRTKGLRIRVLKWNTPVLFEFSRRTIPFFWLNWITPRRLQFKLDSDHPATGSQHQKLVVIDDAVAFCGGIDLTDCRWDCRDHAIPEPRRVAPSGATYSPVHDMAMMVDGHAARALGELARDRWKCATGKTVRPPPPTNPSWPRTVTPEFKDVDVAIARTAPEWDGRPGVREIEALNIAALASAKRFVYVENQHFASRIIYESVLDLLQKPDGPEILVINPDKCPGWVEEMVMGEARTQIINQLHRADRYGRFRIYTPHGRDGSPVYVHSKCLVVDDHFLRVGSSNFNNRSMGFDKECDLAIAAAGPGEPEKRRSIARIRDLLVSEHLGITPEALTAAVTAAGSWLKAVEELRQKEGRTIRPIPFAEGLPETTIITDSILDPEHAGRLPV
jgi:phospholipase D1/2